MTKIVNGRRVGGPCHLDDPAFVEEVVKALEQGAPIGLAAEYAGTTHSTLNKYVIGVRDLGHDSPEDCIADPVFVERQGRYCAQMCDLLRRMRKARATHRYKALDKINRDPSWQSAAWMLERTDPANFAKTERLQIDPSDTSRDPLEDKVTPQQMETMAMGVLQTIGAAAVINGLKQRMLTPPASTNTIDAEIVRAEGVAEPEGPAPQVD